MEQVGIDGQGKIVLPQNLQREMIKFLLKTSLPRIAEQERQLPTNLDIGVDCFD